jgi:hypothetical protein
MMRSQLGSARILALCLAISLVFLPSLVSIRPTFGQQILPGAQSQTSGPAVVANPTRLPPVVQAPPQVRPRLSQVDPATLARLKQRHAYPGAPIVRDRPSESGPVPGPLTPTLQRGFEGVNQDTNVALGFLARPPDPDIAAGPNHIIQVENVVVRISMKDGTTVSTTSLATWFSLVGAGCGMNGCDPFDPRVAYDPVEGHWILIALHQSFGPPEVSRMLVSVSQTSNPTGLWNLYNLDGSFVCGCTLGTGNTFSDFPDVGFDLILSTAPTSGAIYLTTNNFMFTAPYSFRTSIVWILSKAQLYTGAVLSYLRGFDFTNFNGTQAFTYRTAKMYGANPGVGYLVNSTPAYGYFLTLWSVTPTYPPAAISMTRQATIMVGDYYVPPPARQPACDPLYLETSDNRLINAVWRNNQLYTMLTESNGDASNIRYNRINTSTNTLGVSVSIGDGTNFYFMPSVAVENSGNTAIAFTRSGTGEFASARYTGVNNSDIVQPSTLMHAGAICNTGYRWGDYSGAAVDPVGFRRIWLLNEWSADSVCAACTGTWDWSTWAARVQFGVMTTIDVYNPATGTFYLRNSNSAGAADLAFSYGPGGLGWIPIYGDWTGQGIRTVGLYNPATSTFYLRNSNSAGPADLVFGYGPAGAGWLPVVGDWNGDGVDTVGLYNSTTSTFYLRNSNSAGPADLTFGYGPPGADWTPLAGDWDGDGIVTVAVYNPATGTFYLRNSNSSGPADLTFGYGPGSLGWVPRVGDWDGNGTTTVAVYNPATGSFYERNSNSAGVADIVFGYGPGGLGWLAGAGDWDGN